MKLIRFRFEEYTFYVFVHELHVCYCSFKKSLDLVRNWPVVDRVASSTVEQFNHIVLAFCDALWRCLLFVEERQSNFKSFGFSFTKYVYTVCNNVLKIWF